MAWSEGQTWAHCATRIIISLVPAEPLVLGSLAAGQRRTLMDELKKLEMDLGSLISQAEKENANFSHQLYIRQRIQEVTSQLSQSNAYAIELLTEHMRAMTRH